MRIAVLSAVWLACSIGGCATSPRAVQNPPGTAPGQNAAAENPSNIAPAPLDSSVIMVERATAMLGQPYRFGGAAPGGFDCSGLVAYAAAGAGIQLPRTTQDQMRAGAGIARREIKAADLVFMSLAHKELHVGIAIDGTRFIHAPSAGGYVRIDSLAAAPYSQGFLAARRIIDAPPLLVPP